MNNTQNDDSSSNDENDNEDEVDDLITLKACGITTQWKFPAGLKNCPVMSCRVLFGVRSDAITHYIKKHASHSILCKECNKPIITHYLKDFKKHYNNVHPKLKIPFDFEPSRKAMTKVKTNSFTFIEFI